MSNHIVTMREVNSLDSVARISVRTRWGGKERGKRVQIGIKNDSKEIGGNWTFINLTPFQASHLGSILSQLHEPEETGEVKEYE